MDELDTTQEKLEIFAPRRSRAARLLPAGILLLMMLILTGFSRLDLAFGLVIFFVVHELGHIRAARRIGATTRGLYLIPFAGGMAERDSLGRTRHDQAVIAFGGLLSGVVLALPALLVAATVETGGVVRGWLILWATLNVLDLLPLHLFDGGRIVHAVVDALHPYAALGVTGAATALLAALAIFGGDGLLLMLAVLAVFEFLREYRLFGRFQAIASGDVSDEPLPGTPSATTLARAALHQHEDALAVELYTKGRLDSAHAILFLAVYLALWALYGSLLVVALLSPTLEPVVGWGLL